MRALSCGCSYQRECFDRAVLSGGHGAALLTTAPGEPRQKWRRAPRADARGAISVPTALAVARRAFYAAAAGKAAGCPWPRFLPGTPAVRVPNSASRPAEGQRRSCGARQEPHHVTGETDARAMTVQIPVRVVSKKWIVSRRGIVARDGRSQIDIPFECRECSRSSTSELISRRPRRSGDPGYEPKELRVLGPSSDRAKPGLSLG